MDHPQGTAATRSNVLVVASLTLSLISLFVAISGVATAGNTKLPANSVGPKQLQNGAVTPPDVAPNAIRTQALASASVQSTDLAPAAVTTTSIAPGAVTEPTIAANAVGTPALKPKSIGTDQIKTGAVGSPELAAEAVIASKLGPRAVSTPALSIPELTVHAADLTADVDMGDCQGMDFVDFNALRSNPASMFNVAKPSELVAPVDGVYSLTLTTTWSNSVGYVRAAYVSRARGNALDVVGLPGEAPGPTGYPQTMDGGSYELEAGDALKVAPVACAVGMTPATAPTLDSFNVAMKWVAQPAG